MKHIATFSTLLLALPAVTHAQSLQTFLRNLVEFINIAVIPFLLAVGFLIFVFNAVRYFVYGSNNEKGRENAKYLAAYAIIAIVLIIIFAGVINMLARGLGLEGEAPVPSDYVEQGGGYGPGNIYTDDPCEINPNSPYCSNLPGSV